MSVAWLLLVALPSVVDSASALTLGRWLVDVTNSRLLLPYVPKGEKFDLWTDGREVVFEEAGAPPPGTKRTTTPPPITTTAQAPIAAKSSTSSVDGVDWYGVTYSALSHEAGHSQKKLAKALALWMEHESDFDTRKRISAQ